MSGGGQNTARTGSGDPAIGSQLSKRISELHTHAKALSHNIDALAAAMCTNNSEHTNTVLFENTHLLKQLEWHNKQLQAWLKTHGFAENTVSAVIATLPKDHTAHKLWQVFTRTITDCQIKNTANGALARGQLKHTEQTLSLLTGNPTNTQTAYTQMGTCPNENASRKLAKA